MPMWWVAVMLQLERVSLGGEMVAMSVVERLGSWEEEGEDLHVLRDGA